MFEMDLTGKLSKHILTWAWVMEKLIPVSSVKVMITVLMELPNVCR